MRFFSALFGVMGLPPGPTDPQVDSPRGGEVADGLDRQVGADRGGAVADEQRDVVGLAGVARLDDEADPACGSSP